MKESVNTQPKKMRNKITTKSYALKRLKDCGYRASVIDLPFDDSDKRKWIILIDEGVSSVFLIMMADGTFRLYDGMRFTHSHILHNTTSMEVLLSTLNDHGIINKFPHRAKMQDAYVKV
jgi:hypothetical protein